MSTPEGLNVKSPITQFFIGLVQHYNEKKYWKMRAIVIGNSHKYGRLIKLWYLYRIKKTDAYNNASLGTNLGFGAKFDGIPRFPHGLYGVIVSPYAKVGKNVRIFHQVTIGDDGRDKHNAPTIQDDVFLYPDCKILGKITIGKGAKIGANAVVSFDVPPYAIVTCNKPNIKIR